MAYRQCINCTVNALPDGKFLMLAWFTNPFSVIVSIKDELDDRIPTIENMGRFILESHLPNQIVTLPDFLK